MNILYVLLNLGKQLGAVNSKEQVGALGTQITVGHVCMFLAFVTLPSCDQKECWLCSGARRETSSVQPVVTGGS